MSLLLKVQEQLGRLSLEDIRQVRNIFAVLMGGELFDREHLDALLAEVEAEAEAARAAADAGEQ